MSIMDSYQTLALDYDVSEKMVQRAVENVKTKRVLFFTVSGKIGAGKDTVAPRLVEYLGYTNSFHEFFARPLREEVNQIIDCINRAPNIAEAVRLVEEELHPTNFYKVIDVLYDDVKAGIITNSYQRTDATRMALQWWGTEVRRAQDKNYWVNKAMHESIKKLASDFSVFVTDSRFPNEADAVKRIGGTIIRLDVSEDEQSRRIMNRDGVRPKPEDRLHASELGLDDYEFENSISTDNYTLDEVVELAAKFF